MRPTDFVDYYEILGIQPGASGDDVREAWRRCARLYHPDLNPRKTSFRFQRAKEAYDVLNNPTRRKQYDREYRLRSSLLNRAAGQRRRTGGFVGTPPGGRTPPGPTPRTGSSTAGQRPPAGPPRSGSSTGSAPPRSPRPGPAAAPNAPRGAAGRAGAKPPVDARPPGARGGPAPGSQPTPGTADVRTRTTFRPATIVREERGAGMVDALKDAITQGGVSRVAVRHNGNIVWQTHITSALMDDIARWLVGPLTALLRLLGGDERFQIELTNELMEEYNRGNELFDRGKLEEAKAVYKRCIERDRYFADGHLSLGAVYEAQQDIPVAIDCYRNAVKIDPSGEAGRFARENLRRLRGY